MWLTESKNIFSRNINYSGTLFRIINLFKLLQQNTKPNIQNDLNCCMHNEWLKREKKINETVTHPLVCSIWSIFIVFSCSLLALYGIFEGVASNSFNDRNNSDSTVLHIAASRSYMYFDVKVAHIMSWNRACMCVYKLDRNTFFAAWNTHNCRIAHVNQKWFYMIFGILLSR